MSKQRNEFPNPKNYWDTNNVLGNPLFSDIGCQVGLGSAESPCMYMAVSLNPGPSFNDPGFYTTGNSQKASYRRCGSMNEYRITLSGENSVVTNIYSTTLYLVLF